MRQRQTQLTQALHMVLRRFGPKQRPLVLAAVVLAIMAYTLLAPTLQRRWGWPLPQVGSDDKPASSDPTPAKRTSHSDREPATPRAAKDADSGDRAILQAFRRKQSNIQVTGTATVKKLLPDDNLGDRHQKMILELPSGHTLLLAHNLDLAARIPAKQGDKIEFDGEYEYSEQGGVLHWTHHDPRRSHPDGWVKHRGTKYQ